MPAYITRIERHRDNPELIRDHGEHPTVDVAKGYAEALARRYFPTGELRWKAGGLGGTWLLMCEKRSTFITVSWIER